MAIAKSGDTIKVHYTGKLADDSVFDSSVGGDPFEFTVGQGQVIPGFDTGVEGMEVGDKRRLEITPEEGYGDYRPEYVRAVPRDEIKLGVDPQVGMELELRDEEGDTISIVIIEVSEETVTLDANHPLSGETLIFDIERVA